MSGMLDVNVTSHDMQIRGDLQVCGFGISISGFVDRNGISQSNGRCTLTYITRNLHALFSSSIPSAEFHV